MADSSPGDRSVAPGPEQVDEFLAVVRGHREALRFAEAEAMLKSAQEKWPDDYRIYEQSARLAEQQRDRSLALSHWQRVKELAPDYWLSYAGPAACLRELGQYHEAELLLQTGQQLCPDRAELFIDFAFVAMGQRDWANADERWATVRDRFPDAAWGFVGGATALRELGRIRDADALASEAFRRWPEHLGGAIEYIRAAEGQADWPEAIRRARAVKVALPNRPEPYVALGRTLAAGNRMGDADALLAEARGLFPGNRQVLELWAEIGSRQSDDPSAAIRHWEEALKELPENPFLTTGLFHAKMRAFDLAVAQGEAAAASAGCSLGPGPHTAQTATFDIGSHHGQPA